jgi:hypothetical protein
MAVSHDECTCSRITKPVDKDSSSVGQKYSLVFKTVGGLEITQV